MAFWVVAERGSCKNGGKYHELLDKAEGSLKFVKASGRKKE